MEFLSDTLCDGVGQTAMHHSLSIFISSVLSRLDRRLNIVGSCMNCFSSSSIKLAILQLQNIAYK